MSGSTDVEKIWNRACGQGEISTAIGDIHLEAMLTFHNIAMNGGILHAIGYFNQADFDLAIPSYRYFNFDTVAAFLVNARARSESEKDLDSLERELDHEYMNFIPNESTLFDRLKILLSTHPHEFAPIC